MSSTDHDGSISALRAMKVKLRTRKGRGHLQLATLAAEEIEAIDVPVRSERDILTARQRGKALADAAGFSASDATLISFVISELARTSSFLRGGDRSYYL